MNQELNLAPIILFIYNRPDHTEQTLQALSQNLFADKSDLFIYADGAKESASEEQKEKIRQTREVAKSKNWCKNVTVIESEKNNGLAASIIKGVTEIVNKYGSAIILEDDLITSPYFLKYMNDALTVYKNEEKVACIHGYVEPHKKQLPETFFLKGADCWGWATWKRAWDFFNPNGQQLLDEIHSRHCEKHFDYGYSFPYVNMLQEQIDGKINSWAIRWYASAYLKDMYCLYPNKSLVINCGFDGSGTHCGELQSIQKEVSDETVNVIYQTPKECKAGWKAYRLNYLKRNNKTYSDYVCESIIRIIKAPLKPAYRKLKKLISK